MLTTPEEMDRAAKDAKIEWNELTDEQVEAVKIWMKKWYMKAGYKRLGKMIVGKY